MLGRLLLLAGDPPVGVSVRQPAVQRYAEADGQRTIAVAIGIVGKLAADVIADTPQVSAEANRQVFVFLPFVPVFLLRTGSVKTDAGKQILINAEQDFTALPIVSVDIPLVGI